MTRRRANVDSSSHLRFPLRNSSNNNSPTPSPHKRVHQVEEAQYETAEDWERLFLGETGSEEEEQEEEDEGDEAFEPIPAAAHLDPHAHDNKERAASPASSTDTLEYVDIIYQHYQSDEEEEVRRPIAKAHRRLISISPVRLPPPPPTNRMPIQQEESRFSHPSTQHGSLEEYDVRKERKSESVLSRDRLSADAEHDELDPTAFLGSFRKADREAKRNRILRVVDTKLKAMEEVQEASEEDDDEALPSLDIIVKSTNIRKTARSQKKRKSSPQSLNSNAFSKDHDSISDPDTPPSQSKAKSKAKANGKGKGKAKAKSKVYDSEALLEMLPKRRSRKRAYVDSSPSEEGEVESKSQSKSKGQGKGLVKQKLGNGKKSPKESDDESVALNSEQERQRAKRLKQYEELDDYELETVRVL